MSDSLIVLVNSKELPSVYGLCEAVKELGLELESWEDEGVNKLEDVQGFWPGVFRGEAAGFEFFVYKIDNDDLENWKVDKSTLTSQDYVVDLAYYEELDVVASVICATVLCKMCHGLTFGDDEELSIDGSNCNVWANHLIGQILKEH